MLARELVAARPDFQRVLGPSAGDHATAQFMKALQERALSAFGIDHSEQRICGENSFRVDFYFRDEATVVEVALGLPYPNCEFEKDVLKALIAKELGNPVSTLFFISRAGAAAKCNQAGRRAIIEWSASKHGIAVEVHDLPGEPRRRVRNRTRQSEPLTSERETA